MKITFALSTLQRPVWKQEIFDGAELDLNWRNKGGQNQRQLVDGEEPPENDIFTKLCSPWLIHLRIII